MIFFRIAFFLLFCLLPFGAHAQEQAQPKQGVSLHGEPMYGEGFGHYNYADPDAPKGGEIRLAAVGTYDSLNPYILKGDAADGSGLVFETLMDQSLDEPFSQYGRIAESVTVAPDRSWVSYQIRPQARFHDGKSIKPEDVIFSFEILRDKGHPFYRSYYKDVVKAEKIGERGVKFTFASKGNTELPLIMGQLPVLAKHFWEGKDFTFTTLSPIVGSGPYMVDDIAPSRSITYKRVKDWWGKDLPINRGRYNFDIIRYDYYRDMTVTTEAFLSGRYDFRAENIAKNWATVYNTPAVNNGLIIKEDVKNENPNGMQGFVYNTRRDIFKDKRVREALSYAFDFEWSNKNVAYSIYKRTDSYFAGSELAAQGLPSKEELALLEPYRGKIPEEVFTTEFKPPVTDGSGDIRDNLKKASDLLREAGWMPSNGKLTNSKGQVFTFEIIDSSPAFERWIQPFLRNLERLGIKASLRIVDSAQYQNLIDTFNFDMVISVFPQSLSPGNELRDMFTSARTDVRGGKNVAGIKDPVVDGLVEKIIHSSDRASLVTACRALDRVLLWNHYVIPHWRSEFLHLAYWDMFGHPPTNPKYAISFPDFWWIDQEKLKKVSGSMKRNR